MIDQNKKITSHKELAELIKGKRILLTNSLGKDSILALEWLVKAASPAKIISVFYGFLAKHPDDDKYLEYLKRRYPSVDFLVCPNTIEINLIADGIYQSPLAVNYDFNHFEYEDFDRGKYTKELKKKFNCDYICSGFSKYEGFARASLFYKQGLLKGDQIFPLGLMNKKQIYQLISKTGIKLHPSYKFSKGTYDHPSYHHMRNGIVTNEEFKNNLYKWYPLMRLDEYRYKVLFNDGRKKES